MFLFLITILPYMAETHSMPGGRHQRFQGHSVGQILSIVCREISGLYTVKSELLFQSKNWLSQFHVYTSRPLTR